jgi:hypothetical protein
MYAVPQRGGEAQSYPAPAGRISDFPFLRVITERMAPGVKDGFADWARDYNPAPPARRSFRGATEESGLRPDNSS